MNSRQLLDAIKARHEIYSDNQLALRLRLTRAQVSRYRHGHDAMSDETAILSAQLLDLPPAQVLAWIHAERSKHPLTRDIWMRAAAMLGPETAGASAPADTGPIVPKFDLEPLFSRVGQLTLTPEAPHPTVF